MIGRQLAFGAVFLVWASWRLRPVARRLADGPRRRTVRGWVRGRSRARPPCGDDPMLWKDRYFSRWWPGPARSRVRNARLWPLGPVHSSTPSFANIARLSTSSSRTATLSGAVTPALPERDSSAQLLGYSVLFYIAALLAVAIKSATGVTGEREARTWDGVLATPLEPAEIVRAKVLGALARQRALLCLVLAPWLFGLALGALHPIGLLLAITGLAVFLYFASALGTLFSLRSKTSGRALVRTLGVLLMLNLGTVVVGVLLVGSREFGVLLRQHG